MYTHTLFLKSKVAHTHSHMNDLRYTKSDTRMLVKQRTVTMRLAVIVAMLTHGVYVCVCVCTSHRVTFCHTELKHAYTVIINPPIPIVVPPPPLHTHMHAHAHISERNSTKKPKRPTRFRIICDAMKFLVTTRYSIHSKPKKN